MIAALLASFWVLHAIAVLIVESFGISGTAYAAICRSAHASARSPQSGCLRSKSIGSSASYSDIQFKIVKLISSIKTTRSRSVLAERSQEVQQFQRPGIDHARMTSSAGAQGILRQAQTGSPAQSRTMFPRATFLSPRIMRYWSREP